MRCLTIVFAAAFSVSAIAQSAPQPISSDATAVALAQKALAALTGGVNVSDVSIAANVTSDNETGTANLLAKGIGYSRIDTNVGALTRSDVRNVANGNPGGAWVTNGSTATAYANHNCWTDAAWFFPALSSLTQTSNPSFVFKYVGLEQRGGTSVQHIQVFQLPSGMPTIFHHLSTEDFYLDAGTLLPSAVAFSTHPDGNAGTDIAVEVDFLNYQTVGGVVAPLHIQKFQQGSLLLDIQVSSVAVNQGLGVSLFSVN